MVGALSACTQIAPELPSSEYYTREWVKEFGTVDPAQDWNNAVQGSVDVSVAAPSTVRVIANIGGKKYLLARYADVQGTRKLTFDIPRGVDSVLVVSGVRAERAPLGALVDLGAQAPSSPSITSEVCKNRSDWMVVSMLNATIFRRKMPEGSYNADRDGVNVDFALRFKQNDIIIRPLFWHTKNTLEFGLFYVDDATGEPVRFPLYNMEKNTKDKNPDDLTLCWAPTETRSVVVKDFLNDDTFMECLANHGVHPVTRKYFEGSYDFVDIKSLDNFVLATSSIDDRNMTQACREYLDKIGIKNDLSMDPDHRFHYVYRWRTVGETFKMPNGSEVNDPAVFVGKKTTPAKDMEITYTIYNFDYEKAKGWSGASNMIDGVAMDDENYPALISKGIKVHIDDISRSYGGYIKLGEKYMYSLSRFNEMNRWFPREGAQRTEKFYDSTLDGNIMRYKTSDFVLDKTKQAYRAVTWVGTKYSWRYMAFEDGDIPSQTYNSGSCDFDMQDFVFLVEPADVDVDVPEEEEAQPIKWLVACEDLGAKDDFDFNDVVFEVEHVAGEKKAKITPLAAGGTLRVYLMRNGEYAHPDGKIEWHELFGEYGQTPMINTTGITHRAEPFYIDVEENFTLQSSVEGEDGDIHENYRCNMGGFHLQVEREDGTVDRIEAPGRGDAPQMILIFQKSGQPWCWPIERHHITFAYPDFETWMNSGNYDIDTSEGGSNWFDNAHPDHVVRR